MRLHRHSVGTRYRHFLGSIAWLVAACGSELTAPPGEPVLEIGPVLDTDRNSYSWRRDSAFTWLLLNPHGVDVFYYPGNHIYLEHYRDGRWEPIGLYGGVEADPVRLPLGDTLSASVRLSNDVFPKAGWYRVHGHVFRDTSLTALWPLGNRVSPAVWVGP
jgi:hypothetical protein